MRLSTLRITLFTLVLGLIALWVIDQKDPGTSPASTTPEQADPYHWKSTQNITWEITRNQAEQQTTIQTETWHYNESTKLSQFTQPVIIVTTPKTITIIRSQRGQTLNDEAIQLSGDVLITQTPITGNTSIQTTPKSTLSTQKVTYNANQAELLSRDTITLTQANSVTTGVGLHANLDSGQFKLMSNVQSTYQPNKSEPPNTPKNTP